MRRLELMAVAAALAVAVPAIAQSSGRTGQQGTLGDWIHNGQGRVYTPAGQAGNGRVVNGGILNGRVINGQQQCVQQTDRTGRVRTVCPTTTSRDRSAEAARIERERRLERIREAQMARQRQVDEQRLARLERERELERARERQREAQFDRQREQRDDRFDRDGDHDRDHDHDKHGKGRALGHYKNGHDDDQGSRAMNRDEHGGHSRR